MVEDGRSLQQGPEDRNIVIRSEQTSMEQAIKNPFLEKVGFSPQLPQRLMRLNDVLLRVAPPISSVGIEIVPGRIPLITTDITHSSGARVFLRGGADRMADLEIESNFSSGLITTIEDIQVFVKSLFPHKQAKVFSYASEDLKEPIGDLYQDLDTVDSEVLRSFHEFRESKKKIGILIVNGIGKDFPYINFKIVILNQAFPGHKDCLLAFEVMTVDNSDMVGCCVSEFSYRGRTKDVEDVMEKVADLFNRTPLYPFRESPKEGTGK